MPFNINKSQFLQGQSRNTKSNYEMRGVRIKSIHSVKDLGGSVTSNFKFSQQCHESVIKANRMAGLIKRMFLFKNKDVVLFLYDSFVRPQLVYAVQFWSPHHAKSLGRHTLKQLVASVLISVKSGLGPVASSFYSLFFSFLSVPYI